MATQIIQVLIFVTVNITLSDKRNFADMTKLRIFWLGGYLG